MNRLTIIGALLLVLAVGVVYVSSSQFQTGFNNSTIIALSIGPNSIAYSNFSLANNTFFGFVYYTNSIPIDYFLLNGSAFGSVSGHLNSSAQLPDSVNSLSGRGVIYASYNSDLGAYPDQSGAQQYGDNSSVILPSGTYYGIFDNPTASNTVIYYSPLEKQQTSISKSIFSTAAYGITGVALFIAGIVAFLYSLFMARKPKQQGPTDEEVSRLYSGFERRGKARKSHVRHARAHRH